jgi:hypothetical protein
MKSVGVSKQEHKINEMSAVAEHLHPGLNLLSIKGAFRLAIETSLGELGYSEWKEVAGKSPQDRARFFDAVCAKAVRQIVRIGLPGEKAAELEKKLRLINQKYLQA